MARVPKAIVKLLFGCYLFRCGSPVSEVCIQTTCKADESIDADFQYACILPRDPDDVGITPHDPNGIQEHLLSNKDSEGTRIGRAHKKTLKRDLHLQIRRHHTTKEFIDLSRLYFPQANNVTMGSIAPEPVNLPFRLDGKVALVTGSGRGIGASIAVELARNGAKVVVNYSRASGPAEKVVQQIKALGSDAIAIKADVSNVSDTVRLFEEAVKHFGQLDIVSSNAGVVSFGHLEEVTEVTNLNPQHVESPSSLTSMTGRI